MDFLDRNKQLAGSLRDVPDRPWGRGSTGVLWVEANRIPINCSIFSKNGTVSLANLHTFVVLPYERFCYKCIDTDHYGAFHCFTETFSNPNTFALYRPKEDVGERFMKYKQ